MRNAGTYRILVLLLPVLLAVGCVSNTAPRGIAVETLRPIQMEEDSLCGEVALVKARLTLAPAVRTRLSKGQQDQIAAMARAKFEDAGFLRQTDKVSASLDSDFHDLIISINDLRVEPDQTAGGMVQRTARVAVAASLEKELVGCYTATPYTKEEVRQVASDQKSMLPSPGQLQMQAVDKALDRVIRQFVPKRVHTFRAVRGTMGMTKKVATLLESGNCDLAFDMASTELEAGESTDLHYLAGVAAECLATKNKNRDRKRQFMRIAKTHYTTALTDDPSDEDVARAARDAGRQLYYLELSRQHEQKAKEQSESADEVKIW